MNDLELELELEKLLRKSISDDYTTTIIRDLFEEYSNLTQSIWNSSNEYLSI